MGLALTGRAGVDLEHGLYAIWRGDVLLTLSWYGRVIEEDATAASAPPRP